MFRFPIGLDEFVAGGFALACEHRYQLNRAFPAIERRNQRLHNADSSIVGARIAPSFEIMGFVHVPVAKLRSLIVMKTESNA